MWMALTPHCITLPYCVLYCRPLLRTLERMRTAATSVTPRSWHPATPQEIERMGGQCAICWGDMGPEEEAPAPGGEAQEAPTPADAAAAGAGAAGAPAAGEAPAPAAGGAPPQQVQNGGGAAAPEAPAPAPNPFAAMEGAVGAEGEENSSLRAMGLPCSHAYHEGCLLQWLSQCYG
jgi:hypothetical protein